MRLRALCLLLPASLGLAFTAGQAVAAPGYIVLPRFGANVLKDCNPASSGWVTRCKVTSLPGAGGYALAGSRSTPIVKNDVTVGTLYDKVWRSSAHPNRYIFGMKVVMNANEWDPTGLAFNVNDLARRLRPWALASAAYYLDDSTKALIAVGRTASGLNEYEEEQPERDNSWVDFRVDANAAEPAGTSSASSPWVLVKTRAPAGYALQPFGVRILSSDFDSSSASVDVFVPAYQPNGVPENEDDDDDD
jgi:hypothetical protein